MDGTVRTELKASTPGACSTLADALLHGKKERDRIAAADALGDIGSDEAVRALVAYFDDTYSGALNEAAAASLAKCGEPGLKALIDLLHDVKSRSLAEKVLRDIDDPGAAKALEDVGRQREGYLAVSGWAGLTAERDAVAREQWTAVAEGKSPNGPPWKRVVAWLAGFVVAVCIWALPLGRLGQGENAAKYFVALAAIIIVSRLTGRLLGLPSGWRWWLPLRPRATKPPGD